MVAAPRVRPPTHAAWVVVGAVAVQLAVVMGPWVLAFGLDGVRWGALSFILPVTVLLGLWRQSPWILLAGVPLAWALPAHGLPPGALAGQVGAVALLAVAAYVPTALAWLRPREPHQAEVAWEALDDDPEIVVRRPLPWVAGWVVALPAVGVALWPALGDAVVRGFPGMEGRAHVALTLMVLLVGLGLATDLARGRTPLRAKPKKIMVLSVVGLLTLVGGLLAR